MKKPQSLIEALTAGGMPQLEAIDPPTVFRGNTPEEQSACDLVIALALVYNDFKDILILNGTILNASSEMNDFVFSNLAGMATFMFRIQLGFLHELLMLLESKKEVFRHEAITKTLMSMPKGNREQWHQLIQFVDGKDTDNSAFLKKVLRLRNNYSFHYQAMKRYSNGYAAQFLDKPEHTPKVTRGNTMRESRFIFADDVVRQCVLNEIGIDQQQFSDQLNAAMTALNRGLIAMVQYFIMSRGGTWARTRQS